MVGSLVRLGDGKYKLFNLLKLGFMEYRISNKYRSIVKKELIAAAGVSPLGLLGNIDAVGVGAVWTTMFIALRKKSGTTIGNDPKRISVGVASGIARYYLGCKAATYAFFLVPGVGPFAAIAAGLGISAVCNIFLRILLQQP